MEERRRDLEGERPARPQRPKEPHCNDGFRERADERGDHGEAEELAEEGVRVWEDAVEDDGDVREKLGDDVESAWVVLAPLSLEVSEGRDGKWTGHIPHTVHSTNSMVASFSFTSSKDIAIALCPIIMVPMWWPTLTGETFGR